LEPVTTPNLPEKSPEFTPAFLLIDSLTYEILSESFKNFNESERSLKFDEPQTPLPRNPVFSLLDSLADIVLSELLNKFNDCIFTDDDGHNFQTNREFSSPLVDSKNSEVLTQHEKENSPVNNEKNSNCEKESEKRTSTDADQEMAVSTETEGEGERKVSEGREDENGKIGKKKLVLRSRSEIQFFQ
jgi:uncharacterized protein with ParB-like and HNH nuclease domain